MFSPRKSAQIAAFFTDKEGGSINIVKLMKLVYLSDRMSMDEYAYPITYDDWCSMDYGPVPSETYDLAKGSKRDLGWDHWMGRRQGTQIATKQRNIDVDTLLELSVSDTKIMQAVWEAVGHMDRFELADYTHKICGEWIDPNGSSLSILPEEMLEAIGRPKELAKEQADVLRANHNIDEVFKRAV